MDIVYKRDLSFLSENKIVLLS